MADSVSEEFEVIELEYTEDDIVYYIEDEDGNELGFAILDEDGNEVEYYYDGDSSDYEAVEPSDSATPKKSNAASKAGSSKPKRQTTASAQAVKEESLAYMAGHAAATIRGKAAKAPDVIKEKTENYKPAVSKEELKDTANDLNSIYKDGKEVASELKSAYDEISGMFDFIPGKKKLFKR